MGAFDNILRKRLEAIRLKTIADQKAKDITASGKSAQSLTVDVKENTGTLSGFSYFEQQEFGRGPTRNGGRGVLRQRIREWLDEKSWSRRFDEDKKDSLSYAITHNIHKRGTLRGNTAQYPGLDLTGIAQEEIEAIRQEVGAEAAVLVGSDIDRIWKKLIK